MLLLVGDIGGTKTRLRLVKVNEGQKSLENKAEKQYTSQNYPDLVPIIEDFLGNLPHSRPEQACLGIAGPVVHNTCQLTNLKWLLSGERLERELQLTKVTLINDFAAISYGVLGLTEEELHPLQKVTPEPNQPIAVIGAGTGLGQGFLIPQGSEYQIFASEGGHCDFAPRSELEWQLLEYLQNKYNLDRVSVERVVSGQGIVAIYQFLRDIKYAPESEEIGTKIRQWEQGEKTIDPSAIISHSARSNTDSLCAKTLEIFVEAYGAEVGNLALKLIPSGGIYIAGGIAAKILHLMTDGRFITAYKAKGRMSLLLEKIPLHVVLNAQVGLLGCAICATGQSILTRRLRA